MNLFVSEIVTPPAHLPVTVAAADTALASAVVEEIERCVLWRAMRAARERRIVIRWRICPNASKLEPVAAIVSLTRWTPGDAAKVIPACVLRLPFHGGALGSTIAPTRR